MSKKTIAQVGGATEDPFAGFAILAGIYDLDVPVEKSSVEVVVQHLLAMPCGQNKVCKTLRCIEAH